GLDPTMARAMLDLIRGPLRARGQTILLTDHQSAEMAAVADRIAVLGQGRIVMHGDPATLLARLTHVTVIEAQTEEMDLPTLAPPSLVVAVERVERPGPLGLRSWRIHARARPTALETVLEWLTQPTGRVVFLAESAPTFEDVLALQGEAWALPTTEEGEPAERRPQEMETL
ncbi:MAG: hypothetical protein ACRDHE_13570, partial [Ktedonobacterales bacterium]